MLIPQRCILQLQGKYSVFVVDTAGIVHSKLVETGPLYHDYWVINSGLNDSDEVVLEGLQKIKDGMKVKAVPTEFQSKNSEQ